MSRTTSILLAALLLLLPAGPALASPGTGDPGRPEVGISAHPEPVYRYAFDRRGSTSADYDHFKAVVRSTLGDRRGWWRSGVTLEPGGDDFTVILASPQAVENAAPVCSAQYSCRVGNEIYINDERWRRGAEPFDQDLHFYRHYVVNHEVGHWLGLGHRDCPAAGAPAPVMQQQSIAMEGCEENWWPLAEEVDAVASMHGTRPRPGIGAPALASWSADRLDVAVRGFDDRLYTRPEGGQWTVLGGAGTTDADLASWGPERLDLVVRGTDGAVWQRPYSGGAWRSWISLGGQTTSGPTVASWERDRLDVLVRGEDAALWRRSWDGSRWSGWTSHGGRLAGDPDAASWGPGRLDLFVRGTDAAVWQRVWHDGRETGWHSLGGRVVGGVAAASLADRHVQVFARGTDDALWTKTWTGSQWSGWRSLGGELASAPDATQRGDELVVAVRGTDGQLWHKHFDGTWSGWRPLP